jgi:hypothetical protein
MADYAKHTGRLPPFENADVISFTRKVGKTIEKSALVLLARLTEFTLPLEQKQYSYHVEPNTGTPFALVTWVPWDATDQVDVIWERVVNELEKDQWELPKVKRELTKLYNAQGGPASATNNYWFWHSFLQRVVAGVIAGDEKVGTWKRNTDGTVLEKLILTRDEFLEVFTFLNTEAGLTGTGAVDPSVFAGLIGALSRGVPSFPLSTYVFRRTQYFPPNFQVTMPNPSTLMQANVIYTRDQVLTGANPPLELRPFMPPGYYQYKAPPMTQQKDARWLWVDEWYHADEYDHFVYDNFGKIL